MAALPDFFHFNGLSLRPIEPADIPVVVKLINEAYAYQDEAKGEPRTSTEQLKERMTASDCYVLVEGSEIVGFIYIEFAQSHAAKFGMLTVAPKHRGKGIGAGLIQAVESYLSAKGLKTLQLDYMSVAPWLKGYYEHLGFRETGLTRTWGTIELIQMEKILS